MHPDPIPLRLGRYAVFLYLLALPLTAQLPDRLNAHDYARLVQLALALFCAACLLSRTEEDRVWRIHPAALLLGGMLLTLGGLSIMAAESPGHAMREASLWLGLFAVAAVIATIHDPTDESLLMGAVVAATALYSGLAFAILVAGQINNWQSTRDDIFFGYLNHRFFSHVQTVMLPLLALVTTSARPAERALRWTAACAAVAGFVLLIVGAGRATALAIAAGALLSLLFFRRRAQRLAAHLSVAAVLGGLLYLLTVVALPALVGAAKSDALALEAADIRSDHARFQLWWLAWEYIESAPWLGIGPMHYAHYPNPKAAHPHNLYLQFAAEWGLPWALAALTAATWGLLRLANAIRTCSSPQQTSVGVGLFTAWLAVTIDALFSGNFVMPMVQVSIAFLAGWSISWVLRSTSPAEQTGRGIALPHRAGRIAAIAILLSQVWLVWNIWPEAAQLSLHIEQVKEQIVRNVRINPRFWSHGWF